MWSLLQPNRASSIVLLSVALLLMGAVAAVPLMAQDGQHQVRGTVTDAEDETPLPGANVVVKGTNIGTTTDMDGRYMVQAPSPTDTLVFSFVGYTQQEIPIDERETIDVQMGGDVMVGEGLVVTGYRVQRREEVTGSVTVVDVADIQQSTSSNVLSSLQGRVPGLSIGQTGSPFGDASALVRGISTLGDNDPLYVIDGVPSKTGAVRQLNPQDIESIQVLRDASTASIYGSRASNGVIIITTQRGREGHFEVSYNGDVTASQFANRHNVLNTEERGRVAWQAAVNDGRDPDNLPVYSYDWEDTADGAVLHSVNVPEYIGDPAEGIRAANTNWYDEISRTGVIQQHNLSASMGTERGSALFSLRYHQNDAIVRNQDFQRITARINSSFNFFDGRLTVGENLSISQEQGTPLSEGLGGTPLNLALIVQPIIPVHTEDGGWGGPLGAGFDDRDNPVRLLEHNKWDQESAVHTFGNVYATLDLTPSLTFSSRAGLDWRRGLNRDINRTYQSGFLSRSVNSLNRTNFDNLELTVNSTLEYGFGIGSHDISVLGGVEAVSNEFQASSTFREDFAVESLNYFVEDAGAGRQNVDGNRTGYSLLSYFGQATWSFQDRYQANFTARLDGSSRFGADNRYGFFPSLSAGWRLTEDPLFGESLDFFSNLMVRGGFGITGNQEIGNEAQFTLFEPNFGDDITWGPDGGTAYDIRGQNTGNIPAGFRRFQTGNPMLGWEETMEVNVGLDFGVLEQRLRGSFDVFYRETSDILIQPPFLAVMGEGGERWFNAANVEARGFDAMVQYRDQIGEVRFDLSGTLSAFRDQITDLPEDVVDAFPGNVEQNILGRSTGSLFGYVVDGIFQNEEEVEQHADQSGAGVGRLRFADLNDDGRISSLDQTWIGNTHPDFEYGLNAGIGYGNFDVRLFLQGVQGTDVNTHPQKVYTDFTGIWTGTNYGRRTLDAWTPENRSSDIPALSLSDDNNEARFSTYFVENGSYLKLREAEVRYTVPERLTNVLAASNISVYMRGENLFTITAPGFTGVDPEVPGQLFPLARNFTVGLNLSF